MKLLFDENLSPSLVTQLVDLFPGSMHIVQLLGGGATDTHLWELAQRDGYAIVSKDNDFRQRSFLSGPPPKIVWLSVGNAGTAAIATLLRIRAADLKRFDADSTAGLLVVNP